MEGIQAQTGPIGPQIPPCNQQCPYHCHGYAEEAERLAKIQGDIAARNRSLTLSMYLFTLVIGSQIAYSILHDGKTLTIPYIEYVYAMMSGAWFGTAGDKIVQLFLDRKATK